MEDKNTPSGNGASSTDSGAKNYISLSATQKACLRYILNHPRCTRWKLGADISRGYSPDVVQYLRQKGIDVITEMEVPQGGERKIGHYSIAPESVARARGILRIKAENDD